MENSIPPQKLERLSVQKMKEEVLSHFHFEKGIAFTFFMMLKDPERLVDIYLNEDRKRVFNPFRFLLIGVAVSTLILINHQGFRVFLAGLQSQNMESFKILEEKLNLPLWDTFQRAQELFLSYQNILIIISLPAVSWITWKFFRSSGYNYAEHLAINGFVFGATYWFSSIVVLGSYFSDSTLIATYLTTLTNFALATYFYFRIFRKGFFRSLFGILLANIPLYLIGILSQMILFLLLLIMI